MSLKGFKVRKRNGVFKSNRVRTKLDKQNLLMRSLNIFEHPICLPGKDDEKVKRFIKKAVCFFGPLTKNMGALGQISTFIL